MDGELPVQQTNSGSPSRQSQGSVAVIVGLTYIVESSVDCHGIIDSFDSFCFIVRKPLIGHPSGGRFFCWCGLALRCRSDVPIRLSWRASGSGGSIVPADEYRTPPTAFVWTLSRMCGLSKPRCLWRNLLPNSSEKDDARLSTNSLKF
jgi:hypothetical protein